VEASFPGVTAFFLQGPAGNQNPRCLGRFEEVRTNGLTVGSAAVQAILSSVSAPTTPLLVGGQSIQVPFAELPDLEELEARLAVERAAGHGDDHWFVRWNL